MTVERRDLWRMFYAVELPPDVRERAAAHAARLREAVPRARASWERPEKLHLTLKFVGEIEQTRVDALARAAERAAHGFPSFELAIEGTGAFPPRGAPRVLWLGVEDASGRLAQLQQRLETECEAEGFARERREFRPHLTIARLRSPDEAFRLAALHRESEFERAAFPVVELILMRSELGPGGSRYTPVSRHGLQADQ